MSKHPYWKWLRYQRRNRPAKGAVAKPWNGFIAVAAVLALVIADQATKHMLYIQYSWHKADDRWLLEAVAFVLPVLVLMFVKRLRLGACFILAGALGNMTSVYLFGAAPNPFEFATGKTVTPDGTVTNLVTFNLADVYQYVGLALLVVGVFQIANDWRVKRCTKVTQVTRTTTMLDAEVLAHFGS